MPQFDAKEKAKALVFPEIPLSGTIHVWRNKQYSRDQQKDILINCVKVGTSFGTACKVAGVDYDSLVLWKQQDPEFKTAIEEAKASLDVEVMGLLIRNCKQGDIMAIKYYLEKQTDEYKNTEDKAKIELLGRIMTLMTKQNTLLPVQSRIVDNAVIEIIDEPEKSI